MAKKFVLQAYASFQNRFWYLFPAPVFRFFAQERKEQRLFLASLTKEEKEEARKQKKRSLFAFSLSFALHSLFVIGFFSNLFSDSILAGGDKLIQGNLLDFDIMDGMLSSEINPVYDKASEFIIKPSSLIKKRKDQSLTALLERLKKLKITGLSGKTSKRKKKYESQIGQRDYKLNLELGWKKRKAPPKRTQLWKRVKTLQSGATADKNVNYGQIMRVIDQHSFQFQECYEKALLRDESLSGKVIFLLKLQRSKVQKAGLELKGKGSPLSRRELTRCLFQESKKLVFSKNKGNISIKFNLIFGL